MFRNTGFQQDCPEKCKLCTKNFDCVLLEDSSKKIYGTTVVDKCPENMKSAGYDDPTIENNYISAINFALNDMICTRKRVSPVFYQIKEQSKKDFNSEPQGVAYLGKSDDGVNWSPLTKDNNPEEESRVMRELARYMLVFQDTERLRLGFSDGLDANGNIKSIGKEKKESIC